MKEALSIVEKGAIQKGCFHYWRGECKVLEELVCRERKCSFCETEKEYNKRQKEFYRKYKPIKPRRRML